VAVGLAAGLAAMLAAAPLLRSMLFGVTPIDARALAAGALALALASLAALLMPLRQALRVHPLDAMRTYAGPVGPTCRADLQVRRIVAFFQDAPRRATYAVAHAASRADAVDVARTGGRALDHRRGLECRLVGNEPQRPPRSGAVDGAGGGDDDRNVADGGGRQGDRVGVSDRPRREGRARGRCQAGWGGRATMSA